MIEPVFKEQVETSNKKSKLKIVLFLFGFIILTTLLTLKLTNIGTNKSSDLSDTKTPEVFVATVAPNITMYLESDKSSLKNGDKATIKLKVKDVPANYKALAFGAAIVIPDGFVVSNHQKLSVSGLDFNYTQLDDNRVLVAGVNSSSKPFSLVNTQELYSFDITLKSLTTGASEIKFEVAGNGAYPAIIGSDLLEANITPKGFVIDKNANQAPVINEISISPINPKKGDSVTITVDATDQDNNISISSSTYSLNTTPVISGNFVGSLSKSFDNLDVGNYVVSVVVKDTKGASVSSSKSFTVRDLDLVVTPVVTPNQTSHVGSVTVKASTTTPGATLRYTDNGSSVTSSSAVLPSAGITISATTSSVTKTIKVKGFKSGFSPSTEVTKTYTVEVANVAPSDIKLTPNTITESRPNKPAVGREVGQFSVTDPDSGQTHTYQLLNNTDTFEVVGNVLKTKVALDFETKSTYDLSIKVTDSKGASATETVTVTITNVMELDLTGDGKVVLRDELVYILDIMFGNVNNPTQEMREMADFDGNGKVEIADLVAWLNIFFGN